MIGAVFWIVLVLVLLSMAQHMSSLERDNKSRRLEMKIDMILKHLGIDQNQGVNPRIVELLKSGQKIKAIKLYRELTGAGLKDAKDYVERL